MTSRPNGITISFDDAAVKKLLDDYISRVRNPRPLLKTLQRFIHAQTMKMFRGPRPDSGAVRGVTWPVLAASTRWGKAALRKHGKAIEIQRPLVRTGKMRDSIRVLKEVSDGFEYGTDVRSESGFPYPGAHNAGGKGGIPPQRRWLFLTGDELRQMVSTTIEYLQTGRATPRT